MERLEVQFSLGQDACPAGSLGNPTSYVLASRSGGTDVPIPKGRNKEEGRGSESQASPKLTRQVPLDLKGPE